MRKLTESDKLELRSIKDNIQQILGQIDEASLKPNLKANKETLNFCAGKLHEAADELVWIVTRL